MSQLFLNQPYYYCAAGGVQEGETPGATSNQLLPQSQRFVFGHGARETCIGGSVSRDYANHSQGLLSISPHGSSSLSQVSPELHHQGTQPFSQSHHKPAIQTPLQSSPAMTVGVKVFSPANKKDFKMYTLRNMDTANFNDPTTLKTELFTQLGDEVVCGSLDFDIGYLVQNEKKWIHNAEDAQDALGSAKHGGKLTLWCTGVGPKSQAPGQKRPWTGPGACSEESMAIKKKKKQSFTEEREERMTEIIANLRERHGSKYSTLQYRLWAEMFINDTHKTLDTAPPYPLFGEEKRPHVSSSSGQLNEALTGLANSIAVALMPNQLQQSAHSSTTASPTKTAQLRSKYMEQLKDLKLRDLSAWTPEEYEDERLL